MKIKQKLTARSLNYLQTYGMQYQMIPLKVKLNEKI